MSVMFLLVGRQKEEVKESGVKKLSHYLCFLWSQGSEVKESEGMS